MDWQWVICFSVVLYAHARAMGNMWNRFCLAFCGFVNVLLYLVIVIVIVFCAHAHIRLFILAHNSNR